MVCNLGVDADLFIPPLHTQLNLVLVVALVSWQMNGNDALIISSGTINSTALLCCAATRGVIVMLQSSVINQAIYVLPPDKRPCVPTEDCVYQHTNMGGPPSQ